MDFYPCGPPALPEESFQIGFLLILSADPGGTLGQEDGEKRGFWKKRDRRSRHPVRGRQYRIRRLLPTKKNFFKASSIFPADTAETDAECPERNTGMGKKRRGMPRSRCRLLRDKMKLDNKKMQEEYSCSPAELLPQHWLWLRQQAVRGKMLSSVMRLRLFSESFLRTPVQEHRMPITKSQSHEYYPYYR